MSERTCPIQHRARWRAGGTEHCDSCPVPYACEAQCCCDDCDPAVARREVRCRLHAVKGEG